MTTVIKPQTRDEFFLAVFLQGALNRRKKSVALDVDRCTDFLKGRREEKDLWTLVAETARSFDGMAVYDLAPGDVSVNMAATACAAENLLGVPRSLAERVGRYGLKAVFDAAQYPGGDAERQRVVWLKYRGRLRRDCLIHQVTADMGDGMRAGLRDYAIARGAFTFFARPEEDAGFLSEVLGWAERNIPVHGWTTDEIAFVRALSLFGDYLIPSDWSCNHSYFARSRAKSFVQRGRAENTPELAGKADPDAHYLSIVVSDGDNVQWLERGFCLDGLYGERLRTPRSYKMSWTAAPMLCRLCPAALEDIYSRAENDTFVCGVSGIGYTNCMTFPRERLGAFARKTAAGMKKADLRVIALLDNLENVKEGEAEQRLARFACRENIAGGIWQLDPDRYESGKGKIFWACGKPFVSVGISLWHPSCRHEGVTKEWLDGIAEKIAAAPADVTSERGYTVLNVHPWSIRMEDVDYLVSRLPERVRIVSAEELIALVSANVAHKG